MSTNTSRTKIKKKKKETNNARKQSHMMKYRYDKIFARINNNLIKKMSFFSKKEQIGKI